MNQKKWNAFTYIQTHRNMKLIRKILLSCVKQHSFILSNRFSNIIKQNFDLKKFWTRQKSTFFAPVTEINRVSFELLLLRIFRWEFHSLHWVLVLIIAKWSISLQRISHLINLFGKWCQFSSQCQKIPAQVWYCITEIPSQLLFHCRCTLYNLICSFLYSSKFCLTIYIFRRLSLFLQAKHSWKDDRREANTWPKIAIIKYCLQKRMNEWNG